jgi:chromate transporter
MNIFLLYLLLLKATVTSFSGLTSLPIVHNDFVLKHHAITERQLNAAVVAGRAVPGPNGLYIVSVGYFVGGIPGAWAGWLAVVTPAFLIIPLLRYLGARAERPAVRNSIQALTFAAAGLIASTTIPLAQDALHGPVSIAIACASFAFMAFTKRDTLWIIAGSAAVGWVSGFLTGSLR